MARTTCLVCFISTVNGCSKKKIKKKPWKMGASSGHITNLKQSILEIFDIYGLNKDNIMMRQESSFVNLQGAAV
jgi:hypothetical protein